MILKGNARGGAKDLASHLMKDENDHVELHELRGFVAENLSGALNEAYALSQGTRCRKFLYSVSVNPPESERVCVESFEDAIDRAEERLGLTGQPRAIVFHEKEGRRHAHVVWSRIDAAEMKAVPLPFDREKLMEISRELFREHQWRMPAGLADPSARDPRNFTLSEWQQAQRTERDPKQIKGAIQDAWAISDTKAGFAHALEERGFKLARGDRRAWVALDAYGEVYSVARVVGLKAKDVRIRLGDKQSAQSLEDAKNAFESELGKTAERLRTELRKERQNQLADYRARKSDLVKRHRLERKALAETHQAQLKAENRARQARFRKGLGGIWDRLRGQHRKISRQNEIEGQKTAKQHRAEREKFFHRQLVDRRRLRVHQLTVNKEHARDRTRLERSFEQVIRGYER
ncbi:MAG: relaxase [Pseudomonadota bacterium]